MTKHHPITHALLLLITATPLSYSSPSSDDRDCFSFSSCASCTNLPASSSQFRDVPDGALRTERRLRSAGAGDTGHCGWWDRSCYPLDEVSSRSGVVRYADECPLFPPLPVPDSGNYLPDWMGHLRKKIPGFGSLSVLDLSLPGTHDSLTYDLSSRLSEGSVDGHTLAGMILHMFDEETDGTDFLRRNSVTQKLNVTEQLSNGVRFLDLRMMYEHDKKEWYSLHFFQSKQPIQHYFKSIRNWIDAHPSEIIVLLITRHGGVAETGDAAYPGVSADVKHKLWLDFLDIFGSVLIDVTLSAVNTTSIHDLIERNHRVIPYVGDYETVTRLSSRALDAALVENYWIEAGVTDQPATQHKRIDALCPVRPRRDAAKARSGFFLLSIATSADVQRTSDAAQIALLRAQRGDERAKIAALTQRCAKSYHIPGMEEWCPSSLLDGSQLTSYYNQFLFEHVLEAAVADSPSSSSACGFPNAFYGDALDVDGTVRTGTQTLFGGPPPIGAKTEHYLERYAYVHSVLAYNVLIGCNHEVVDGVCKEVMDEIQNKRRLYPLKMWEETRLGRKTDWP